MEVDNIHVAEVEVADRDKGVDPTEQHARCYPDYVDPAPIESPLLVGRNVGTPDGVPVASADQVPPDLLNVLVPPSHMGPIPDMHQEDVQRP